MKPKSTGHGYDCDDYKHFAVSGKPAVKESNKDKVSFPPSTVRAQC